MLSISDTNYGFLLSIFGAGIILSSIINIVFSKQLAVTGLIGFGTIFTSIGYVLFYGANGFVSASFAVFIIGLAVTFGNTGYLTYFQDNIPTNMMGRFISIFSVIEAALIISLTLITGLASEFSSIRPVGLVASFAFFILGLIAIKTVNGGKGANLENVSLKD